MEPARASVLPPAIRENSPAIDPTSPVRGVSKADYQALIHPLFMPIPLKTTPLHRLRQLFSTKNEKKRDFFLIIPKDYLTLHTK